MLLLTIALLAAQAADAPKSIFSYDDYPAVALRNRWEGTAIADLTISADGVPTACRIAKSSGYKVLDDATCDLILRRARFKPAKDADGKPTESKFRTPPVSWRIRK